MSLYQDWEALIQVEMNQNPGQRQAFWKEYYAAEKDVYAKLLADHTERLTGKVSELASAYGMEPVIFAGFLDGINESIEPALDMQALEAEAEIDVRILHEKLFYNLLSAKADWLYELPEWDGILTKEQRDEIRKRWRDDRTVRVEATPGRNDPCPCGSGKKYKKCCGAGK